MLSFSTIGWIHTTYGLPSLLTGTVVILIRKGDQPGYRFWGYFYLFSMLATNVTTLTMYGLNGRSVHEVPCLSNDCSLRHCFSL